MDLGAVFDQVANRILVDFERARSAVPHAGIKGGVLEHAVRRFLRQDLPASLDISTGMLVDSRGRLTKQLDVIISDATKTPVLFRDEDVRVIPIECAFAVIEVKAKLDTAELDRVFENMRSVYALEPVPPLAQAQVETVSDQDGTIRVTHGVQHAPFFLKGILSPYYPINYFVFAYDSISLQTLSDHIVAHIKNEQVPVHQRLDMVCVLNRGLISNRTASKPFDALPAPKSGIVTSEVARPLMAFYALMSQYLLQANVPTFDLGHYFEHLDFNPQHDVSDERERDR